MNPFFSFSLQTYNNQNHTNNQTQIWNQNQNTWFDWGQQRQIWAEWASRRQWPCDWFGLNEEDESRRTDVIFWKQRVKARLCKWFYIYIYIYRDSKFRQNGVTITNGWRPIWIALEALHVSLFDFDPFFLFIYFITITKVRNGPVTTHAHRIYTGEYNALVECLLVHRNTMRSKTRASSTQSWHLILTASFYFYTCLLNFSLVFFFRSFTGSILALSFFISCSINFLKLIGRSKIYKVT